MARPGVTREHVFAAADALVQEGQSPTVVAVRTRLGGGSPNTITPLLAEWGGVQDNAATQALPALPSNSKFASTAYAGVEVAGAAQAAGRRS